MIFFMGMIEGGHHRHRRPVRVGDSAEDSFAHRHSRGPWSVIIYGLGTDDINAEWARGD